MVIFKTEDVFPVALRMLKSNRQYELYQRYYKGQHRITFASDKWRAVFGRLFNGRFANNVCPIVIDAVADRLELSGFEVKTKGEATDAARKGNEKIKDAVKEVWEENRMDYSAGRVHLNALRDGDAYVLVWPDPETLQPLIYEQEARFCRVKYDPEYPGRIQWGVKCWHTDDCRIRITFYFADRIEKYITVSKKDTIPTRAGDFVPYDAAQGNTGEPWPVPNTWGIVPLFHFVNNGSVGAYGESELRDVLPLQDVINKTSLDLVAALEYVALPQRWATGLQLEHDEFTGKKISPFTPGVDQLWAVAATDVHFGEFAQGQIDKVADVLERQQMNVARVTGTPLHYFMLMSDPPSGEALKALEARLIKKCLDRQTSFGNTWEDVMRFCNILLGNSPDIKFNSCWIDPAPKSEYEHAQTLVIKKTVGVPRDQLLKEFDYTDAQIEEFAAMREEDALSVGNQLLNQMARGNMDGTGTAPTGATGDGRTSPGTGQANTGKGAATSGQTGY
jgi:hypothetical protein